MKLTEYQARRQQLAAQAPQYRAACYTCRQAAFNCFCDVLRRFNPGMEFLILTHPLEVQRRMATGRMSYLCLENSHLVAGTDYSADRRINELLANPGFQAVVLYPGRNSTNLSLLSEAERRVPFNPGKKLLVVVIDGTWATARTMMRLSKNLSALPRICFSLDRPSNFRIRKQPQAGCFSTIEAIHQVIELLGPLYGFAVDSRQHDNLLAVFDSLVEKQLPFIPETEWLTQRRKDAEDAAIEAPKPLGIE